MAIALVAATLAAMAPTSSAPIANAAANGYPYCTSTSSDPDGDGWGWENNASCLVQESATNGYPYCTSASSDPDGDGWGWANNASCVVLGSAADTGSGGSTSRWESVIDGGSFSSYAALEEEWNYLYPWGSDHNGSARMYASSTDHNHVYLEDGVLVEKASPVWPGEGRSGAEPYLTIRYHSGAIHAKDKVIVNDTFPTWEVRGEFQAPSAAGTWPAFWLTGATSWPPESDILEFKGSSTNWFNTFRSSNDVDTTKVTVSNPSAWHEYRAWITKVNDTDVDIHYYIDGQWKAVHHAKGFVGKPMWIIINLQMEGSSGTTGPTGDTYFKARNVYVGRSHQS